MQSKKRDNKNRVLHDGERQRPDGRYEYRYTDKHGEQRSVYSWTLVKTDTVPSGKKRSKPLRELEKQIEKELELGINSRSGTNTMFDELYQMSSGQKKLRESTKMMYGLYYNKHIKPWFGDAPISSVKTRDLYDFYSYLLDEENLAASTVKIQHILIAPVFEFAKEENLITDNPDHKAWKKICKDYDMSARHRNGLTEEETDILLNYIRSTHYKKHLPLVTIMLGTGCRIGELLALRWDDCDFKNNVIYIRHSLKTCIDEEGKYRHYIGDTKTKKGTREIPMLNEVKQALNNERALQQQKGISNRCTLNGLTGFVFCSKSGQMLSRTDVYLILRNIQDSYNKKEKLAAIREHRDPVLLPKFSAHCLRHTFCTRLCENEANIKIIQDIMGHESFKTTMDIYNEATLKKKSESFSALEGKIRIS